MPETLSKLLTEILRLLSAFPQEEDRYEGVPPALRKKAVKQLALLLQRLRSKDDFHPLLAEFSSTLKAIRENPSSKSSLSTHARRKMAQTLEVLLSEVDSAEKAISPTSYPQEAFNPFAPRVVGELIATTLLDKPRCTLEDSANKEFYGAGVYAIYYTGSFDAYEPISRREHPIYVGKSDPADLHAVSPKQQGKRLWKRLDEHRKNLRNVRNLALADFDCRFLVVHSAWVKPAEDYLIGQFHPVWNKEMKICFGFGKHGDTSSTRANTRSPWDTLHPGRNWATSQPGAKPEEIKARIAEHFKKYQVTARLYHG